MKRCVYLLIAVIGVMLATGCGKADKVDEPQVNEKNNIAAKIEFPSTDLIRYMLWKDDLDYIDEQKCVLISQNDTRRAELDKMCDEYPELIGHIGIVHVGWYWVYDMTRMRYDSSDYISFIFHTNNDFHIFYAPMVGLCFNTQEQAEAGLKKIKELNNPYIINIERKPYNLSDWYELRIYMQCPSSNQVFEFSNKINDLKLSGMRYCEPDMVSNVKLL